MKYTSTNCAFVGAKRLESFTMRGENNTNVVCVVDLKPIVLYLIFFPYTLFSILFLFIVIFPIFLIQQLVQISCELGFTVTWFHLR